MDKARPNGGKNNSIVKLKVIVEKLQKNFFLGRGPASSYFNDPDQEFEEGGGLTSVPKDVKEGHFAVVAVDDGESKRFIVSLSYLSHPRFLRLLEQSAEEFGFKQEGALSIPCRWSELEKILTE